jgi:hypothetical protein
MRSLVSGSGNCSFQGVYRWSEDQVRESPGSFCCTEVLPDKNVLIDDRRTSEFIHSISGTASDANG